MLGGVRECVSAGRNGEDDKGCRAFWGRSGTCRNVDDLRGIPILSEDVPGEDNMEGPAIGESKRFAFWWSSL